jgi:restriction system protein
MARRKEKVFDTVVMAPWWLSIIFGFISVFLLTAVLPGIFAQNQILAMFVAPMVMLSPLVFLFFLFTAGCSAFFSRRKRSLVNGQTSLESLKALSWKEFEWMVGEAFRLKGYSVEESLGGGPDGGVDLVLRKDGRKIIVQCKQWKKWKVGAPIVREQFGILTASNADVVYVVASGEFTKEAINFAAGKPIRLINGSQLLRLISGVQQGGEAVLTEPSDVGPVPDCPKCGELMVLRTARKGKNIGEKFWGCSGFPKCRGNLPLS